MKRGKGRKPLMKSEIELAQQMSKSASQAARLLGVAFDTYKKWATRYGIYEHLLNPSSKGISKTFSVRRNKKVPLKEILEGKHPTYDKALLQHRLIKELIVDECCKMCGFREKRLTDHKAPLKLNHINGNKTDHQMDNLELLCFNCWFLTVGNLVGRSPELAGQKAPKKKVDDES